jgi:superkiller protein 3
LVDAALSEILSMPLDQRQLLDPVRQVDHILAQHHLSQGRANEALKIFQEAVRTNDVLGTARRDLSRFLIQQGNDSAVKSSGVTGHDDNDRKRLSLSLRTASVAKAKSTSIDVPVQKDAERALVLEPWNMDNRLALAYVRSRLPKLSESLND